MRSRSPSGLPFWPTLTALILPLLLTGCDLTARSGNDESSSSFDLDSCTIPVSRLISGCRGGADCIPSIDGIAPGDDRLVEADNTEGLFDSDRVIGLLVDNRPLAVPLKTLWTHEIVNVDRWGGRTFAVTYCPLTGSSLAFDRSTIDGAEFGVSGFLFKNNLVMYDRRGEESLWPQMNRQANCGPSVSRSLNMLPVVEMKWGRWRRLHPDTKVVSDGGDFAARYPYGNYREPNSAPFIDMPADEIDNRRPLKERVLGIPAGDDGGLALPFRALDENAPVRVVETSVGGTRMVVFWNRDAQAAMAFETSASFSVENGRIVDDATGSVWAVDGHAMEGPRQGDHLDRVDRAYVAFWFAWAAFQPETALWTPSS